ncbi:MAG: hypothetical protein NTY22_05075 [Proteobacteria bacterium]|nr:hypothetical protein [Pseudomonadota bacterium]
MKFKFYLLMILALCFLFMYSCSHTSDYMKDSLQGMKDYQEYGSGCSTNYTHTNTGDNSYLRKCK